MKKNTSTNINMPKTPFWHFEFRSHQPLFQFNYIQYIHPCFMPIGKTPRLHGSSEITFLRLVTEPGAALGCLGILHVETWEMHKWRISIDNCWILHEPTHFFCRWYIDSDICLRILLYRSIYQHEWIWTYSKPIRTLIFTRYVYITMLLFYYCIFESCWIYIYIYQQKSICA